MNAINITMETYMQILKKMLKNEQLFMNLYAGITKDVTNQQLYIKPMCGYCIFEIALWKS
jgi:hypothetical protein